MSQLVLICEDEVDIQEIIAYNLNNEGFETHAIGRGDQVVDAVNQYRPQLVLLDIMMPGMSGIDVCKKLRTQKETAAIPIIMLTAKGSETDKVVGLELGADDYMTKPFSPKELVARVKALLRRTSMDKNDVREVLECEDLKVDLTSHKATVKGTEVPLTFTEFRLLKELMAEKGRVLARDQLVDRVMGEGVSVTARAIDVHLASLRKKIAPYSDYIETVRGVGYRFRE